MPFISCLCRNTSSHSSNKFISCSFKPLICSDLIQGLHPSKDPVFAAFEGESFRETLLTSSVVVKRGGLAFGAFPGCVTRCFTLTSRFLPPRPAKVTTYATRYRHLLSFFSKNLGICEATEESSCASSKKREKKEHLKEPSNWDSLRAAL